MRRALWLDDALYAEVAGDASATGQALTVVLAAALAEGLGNLAGAEGALRGVVGGCLRWSAWLLVLHAAALALGHPGRLAPLFRAMGFAAAPFGLAALEGLPLLGPLFWLAKWGLGIAAVATAARSVLGVDSGRAVLLALVGLAGALLVSGLAP